MVFSDILFSKTSVVPLKRIVFFRTIGNFFSANEFPCLKVSCRIHSILLKDMKILNVMITKASREEEDRAMRAKKKLELAEQKNAENEMKQVRLKQHHMLLADKMREFEHLKVSSK